MFAKKRGASIIVLLMCTIPLSYAKGKETFSIPNAVLLFGATSPGFTLISADQSETIRLPRGAQDRPLAVASIGPRGTSVSWGFPTSSDPAKRWKVRCSVGLYSLSDKGWHTFGDFSQIHTTAISSDGSKIAFVADEITSASRELLLLDTSGGQITKLLTTAAVSVSWSPDGSKLVVGIAGGDRPSHIDIFDFSSGTTHALAEGTFAAWSPSGNWIAYFDHSNERVRLTHPDGGDNHIIKDVGSHVLGYRAFGGQPVWSPDGKKLLLNEYKGDGNSLDVVLLDVEDGRMTRESVDGSPIVGWATAPSRN
jgi:WD40-like Beta Propeller Repeat